MIRNIFFVITARASVPRVRSVIDYCKKEKNLRVKVISAASMVNNKYGEAEKDLKKNRIKSDWKINCLFDDQHISSQPNSTANLILQLSSLFHNNKPDAVVTVADRYETMATAVTASYMNIPLIHLLGGEVTGNIDEKVRHAITKLSDIHLVANKDSYSRVKKLGEEKKKIFVTGCPSIDIAEQSKKVEVSGIKLNGVGKDVNLNKDYIVVLQHPDTIRYLDSRADINSILLAINKINLPTIWFWPNPDVGSSQLAEGIRSFRENINVDNIYFMKHLQDIEFLSLINNSKCLVGNSSVGIRECAYLGVPVVNIGERQKNRLRAKNVIDVNHNIENIINAIKKQSKLKKLQSSNLYGSGKAGKQIAKIISSVNLSYKKQINY